MTFALWQPVSGMRFLRWMCAVFALFASLPLAAQNYYVRSGASGNGSDWNNALPSLPSTLIRGATYYVAGGTYPAYGIDDAVSGTARIMIKKAIESDHGTSTGWNSSYGSAQAVFTGSLQVGTSYVTIDGQTGGGPGNWTTGYGFKIAVSSGPAFVPHDGNDIVVRHVEVQGNGGDGDGSSVANDLIWVGAVTGLSISYSYLHDAGRCLVFCNQPSNGVLLEYVYGGRFESTSGQHAEIASIWGGARNWTFRHSIFTHSEGTGGLMMEGDGLEVYGCVFVELPGGSFGGGNGAIGTWSASTLSNLKIYNNSFIGISVHAIGLLNSGDTGEVRNNIFYNCRIGTLAGLAHTHNHYAGVVEDMSTESSRSSASEDPFVDYRNGNFALKAATPAGTVLNAPYNASMVAGNRGADGVWDRGAIEFGGGPQDSTAPIISGVDETSVELRNATIVWTTDEPASGVVEYGTTTGYGLSANANEFGTSHNVALSGLAPSTTYHYRVRATDGAGNIRTSLDFTFRTLDPETTPPTSAISSPAPGSSVSGRIVAVASASDSGSGIADVRFFLSGTLLGTATPTGSGTFTFPWETGSVTNGTYSLSAIARDAAGNQATSPAVSISVQNSGPDLRSGLAGHWRLDEVNGTTGADSSPNGNNGTLPNGGAWVTGRLAGGLVLDGANNFARIPHTASLQLTQAVTLSAWVRPDRHGGWQSVVRKVVQEGSHAYPFSSYDLMLLDTPSGFQARMGVSGADGNRTYATSGQSFAYGSWHHIVGTFDGSAVRLYVNGVEQATAAYASSMVAAAGPVLLGRNGAGGDTFKGVMDDVRIYGRPLSGVEADALYRAVIPPSPAGLAVR